jgi:hypothetical protein
MFLGGNSSETSTVGKSLPLQPKIEGSLSPFLFELLSFAMK